MRAVSEVLGESTRPFLGLRRFRLRVSGSEFKGLGAQGLRLWAEEWIPRRGSASRSVAAVFVRSGRDNCSGSDGGVRAGLNRR